ncbi:hypothetical protein [Maricaulis sp.]|uniref:hypothetical protein n=1 Tax=Maricaulis sp. TaxID=1486257 RepID=UPI002B273CB8|nr:hypothetical protein [Maricaulis sp.]
MKPVFALMVIFGWLAASSVQALQSDDPVHPILGPVLSRGDIETEESEWRYVVTLTNEDGVMVGRFDGTQPDDERWQLVSPARDQLSDTQLRMWSGLQRRDDVDEGPYSGLFFSADDSDIAPGSLALDEESSDPLVFRFQPRMDDEDPAIVENLRGALTILREPGTVIQVRIWAPDSFKPHMAVRVNTFEFVEEFTVFDGIPAPVRTRLTQQVSGRAAFQVFEQNFEMTFTEIEYLGAAPVL